MNSLELSERLVLPSAYHGHSAGVFSTVLSCLRLLTPMGSREEVSRLPKVSTSHPHTGVGHIPLDSLECLYDIPKWIIPQGFFFLNGISLMIPREQD